MKNYISCQCPKRATLISTKRKMKARYLYNCVNALSGLLSFLRLSQEACGSSEKGVNALSGLLSFLRYPLKTLVNTGFPASFLQIFVRISDNKRFPSIFWFVHNLFIFEPAISPLQSKKIIPHSPQK